MERYVSIKIPFRWIPEEIRIQYKWHDLVKPEGYVYCKVCKCMYSLKQASWPAFYNLVKPLSPHGYFPVQKYPGLSKYQNWPNVSPLLLTIFESKPTALMISTILSTQ